MAIFVSKAPNLWVSINIGGEHRSIRFEDGRLNTAVASRRTGIPEATIISKLKENRYYGVRFWEQAEVRDETRTAPPGAPSQAGGLSRYHQLVERAKELGIPYVGVRAEVLEEHIRQAEAMLAEGRR